jgi:precorrin-6y C5,15-methyltransferase (decarboxylating) CbiE subunit
LEDRLLKPVIIAGCGPGSSDYLTYAVVEAVRGADLLVGTSRVLDLFEDFTRERLVLKGNYMEAVDRIDSARRDREVVVLVTGDPGVHSFARMVLERLGRAHCRVLPGVSAVQCAFARLGVSWENAVIFSCHGQSLDGLDSLVRDNPKVVVLTGGAEHPAQIGRSLAESSLKGKDIFLCEDLSLPGEKVTRLSIQQLRETKASPLNMVVIIEEDET